MLVTTQNVINATSRHDTVSFMLLNHPISHALAYRRNRLGLVWAKYFGFEIIIDRDQSPQAKVAATAAALDASQPEGGTTNPGGVGVVNLACPHGVVNYGATVFTFTSPSSRDGSRAPTSSPPSPTRLSARRGCATSLRRSGPSAPQAARWVDCSRGARL